MLRYFEARVPRAVRHIILNPLIAFLLVACDDARRASDVVDADALPLLSAHEELRIGNAEDPSLGFTRLGPVSVDRDGNVYVVEAAERQIRIYDPSGRRLGTIGGNGEGPGEFRALSRIGIIGDTLWVGDNSLQRITLFTRAGVLLTTFRAPIVTMEPVPGVMPRITGSFFRPDGRLLGDWSGITYAKGASQDSFKIPRLVFDTTGRVMDTLGFRRTAYTLPGRRVDVPGGSVMLPTITDEPFRVEATDGAYVVERPSALSAAEGIFTVIRLGLNDDTIFLRRFRYRPRPYEEAYRDTLARLFATSYRSSLVVDPDVLERIARENISLPKFQPPIANYRAAQDDGIWLRREVEVYAKYRWLLLDADGSSRGYIELPSQVTVRWSAGDVFWAASLDSLDVPWLVRYRVNRR